MPTQKPGKGTSVLDQDPAIVSLTHSLDKDFVSAITAHPQYDSYTKPGDPSTEVERLCVLLTLQGVILNAKKNKELHKQLLADAAVVHDQRNEQVARQVEQEINSIPHIKETEKEPIRTSVISILPGIARLYFKNIEPVAFEGGHIEPVSNKRDKPKDSPVLDNTYAYKAETKEKGRWYHAFKADAETLKDKPEYEGLTGDHLKTKILENFKKDLEGISDMESFLNFKEGVTKTPEYGVLAKGQGIATRLFKLDTSSVTALNKMIDDREQQLEILGQKNTPSS